MNLQAELEKLRGLIESAKEKPRQRAEEEIRGQKRDFEISRDQKILKLEELQAKIRWNMPNLMLVVGVIITVLGVFKKFDHEISKPITGDLIGGVLGLAGIVLSPLFFCIGGVIGYFIGVLAGKIACEVLTSHIESLKKQTWKPPQSTPKDFLPP